MKNSIVFISLNLALSIIIENIVVFPWWSFLTMSLLIGFIYSYKNIKINSFMLGFISGVINWIGATLYFHNLYEGDLLGRMAEIFYMPSILFVIVIGVVCGLLNGLACYTGYIIFVKEDGLELD
jgi:hypothetical protein